MSISERVFFFNFICFNLGRLGLMILIGIFFDFKKVVICIMVAVVGDFFLINLKFISQVVCIDRRYCVFILSVVVGCRFKRFSLTVLYLLRYVLKLYGIGRVDIQAVVCSRVNGRVFSLFIILIVFWSRVFFLISVFRIRNNFFFFLLKYCSFRQLLVESFKNVFVFFIVCFVVSSMCLCLDTLLFFC